MRYLIWPTNECDGDIRTRKLRALVIRRDLLLNLPEETPAFDSPTHSIRWKTLQQLHLQYQAELWRVMAPELVV